MRVPSALKLTGQLLIRAGLPAVLGFTSFAMLFFGLWIWVHFGCALTVCGAIAFITTYLEVIYRGN